jgi:leucyl/phenylalanyl-tRNA--protein transferase
MADLRWLSKEDSPASLPDPAQALPEPNGLLAAGGSLAPEWLLESYRRGIFPWFESGQPILWWSPDPRTVMTPDQLHVSRSLQKCIGRQQFEVTADTDFAGVITSCAAPRNYTDSTWITPEMQAAYTELHRLGWAHSFESSIDGLLVGGLYGIAIGRVFFGESMFASRSDASKVAFFHAVRFLSERGIELIDCQLPSAHLSRLGARTMPREAFLAALAQLTESPGTPGSYRDDFNNYDKG